ncbi:MAG TPA: hypothetical protein VER11_24620 [Polyangiaceae bacterium]|nr:hypothetical protein [Polyangiaceae bacterium]
MKRSAALFCVVALVGCGGADHAVLGGTAGNGTTSNQPSEPGGGATQAGGGAGGASGGGAQGGRSSAGASSAGADSSGAGSTCFRPYLCADTCDGEKMNFGCRECPEDLIDTLVYCPAADTATGLFGQVNFLEGNHEPTTGSSSGTTTPVARELRFYAPVTPDSVEHDAAHPFVAGLYSSVRDPLRAKTYSGTDGKYRIALSPGKYSVFVEDGEAWYCNQGSGEGLCVVNVPESGTLEYKIDITYAAAF